MAQLSLFMPCAMRPIAGIFTRRVKSALSARDWISAVRDSTHTGLFTCRQVNTCTKESQRTPEWREPAIPQQRLARHEAVEQAARRNTSAGTLLPPPASVTLKLPAAAPFALERDVQLEHTSSSQASQRPTAARYRARQTLRERDAQMDEQVGARATAGICNTVERLHSGDVISQLLKCVHCGASQLWRSAGVTQQSIDKMARALREQSRCQRSKAATEPPDRAVRL